MCFWGWGWVSICRCWAQTIQKYDGAVPMPCSYLDFQKAALYTVPVGIKLHVQEQLMNIACAGKCVCMFRGCPSASICVKRCVFWFKAHQRKTWLCKEWPSILEIGPCMWPRGPETITPTTLPVSSHQTPHTDIRREHGYAVRNASSKWDSYPSISCRHRGRCRILNFIRTCPLHHWEAALDQLREQI